MVFWWKQTISRYMRLNISVKIVGESMDILGSWWRAAKRVQCLKKSSLSEPVRHNHWALGLKLTKCDVALHYDTAALTACQQPKCGTAERHKHVLMNMYHLDTLTACGWAACKKRRSCWVSYLKVCSNTYNLLYMLGFNHKLNVLAFQNICYH